MTIRTAFLSALFAVVLAGPPNAPGAAAHVFAPSLLELEQTGPSTFDVRWKQPELQPAGAKASPVFPAACRTVGERTLRREETGLSVHLSIECPGGLVGSDLGVEGLASTQAPALVRIGWEDGRTVRRVLDADAPTFLVPAAETTVGIGLSYAHLGLEHIAGGIDHLLFVLGLTLLVRGHRRLLVTVTAFTIGHSITLALAALGVVHVPQGPVEILIAASIYVLAVDLARRHLG
ncbi:MAG: HupE/UreJ family protein, partial [Acidobacteriota bacterium]